MLTVTIVYHKKRGGQPLFSITVESLYKYVSISFGVYNTRLDTRNNTLTYHRETESDCVANHLTDCAVLNYA